MSESIQIDRILTLDIKYTYHASISSVSESGGPVTVPCEPAFVEIESVSIHGSQLMYCKKLWAELAERVMEDYI